MVITEHRKPQILDSRGDSILGRQRPLSLRPTFPVLDKEPTDHGCEPFQQRTHLRGTVIHASGLHLGGPMGLLPISCTKEEHFPLLFSSCTLEPQTDWINPKIMGV
jgi:hypothetical protein